MAKCEALIMADDKTIKAAAVEIHIDCLAAALGLPPGAEVRAAYILPERRVLFLEVHGAGWDTRPNELLRKAEPAIVTVHDDGRQTIDWRLPSGEES